MPETIDTSNLRNDQKYLYLMAKAVSSGVCEKDLSEHKPGKISSVRWTIPAIRILRLYVSTPKPSEAFKEIVEVVMKVYIPCWFWIKHNPSWIHGAEHLFRILSFSRALKSSTFLIIKKKVKNNSYFAHTENVLLAMIADPDHQIRWKGWDKIINARIKMGHISTTDVRTFVKPSDVINDISSQHYSLMIDWDNQQIFEPPFTKQLSMEELIVYRDSGSVIYIPSIPCHSQATEFLVQAVSQAVKSVATHDKQEAHVKSKLLARGQMPEYRSKEQYKCYKLNEI